MNRHITQVDPSLISVVIQGPLYRNLGPERGIDACIASVREHLPKAEIVVSTWPHEDASEIEDVVMVISEDPGHQQDVAGNQINTNRMIRSTRAGINAATRPCIMKFRSDHLLSVPLLATLREPIPDNAPHRIFHRPITVTTLYIRHPGRIPMLYHLSDLVQFGTRDDMLALWDIPLLENPDIFNPVPCRNPFGNSSGYSSIRMTSEQALMIGALNKHGYPVSINHPCDVTEEGLNLWETILATNFHVLDWETCGISFPHRLTTGGFSHRTLYKAGEIECLRQRSPLGSKLNYAGVLLNKYVFNCVRPTWWVSLASTILFSISPPLAKRIRSRWRQFRKVIHSDSSRL
jgi:hypothetical protein